LFLGTLVNERLLALMIRRPQEWAVRRVIAGSSSSVMPHRCGRHAETGRSAAGESPGADQLAALAAVIEFVSFDATAKRLHVTPSAVSQRIKAVEQRVDQVLVVRESPVGHRWPSCRFGGWRHRPRCWTPGGVPNTHSTKRWKTI
jgi:hypothetical protein